MKKFLFYILFSFFASLSLSIKAQNLQNLSSEEKLCYYENKRIGISWYERNQFSKSIYYLEKSFSVVKSDSLMNEYLYFSYVKMNCRLEALSVYPYLSEETKKKYYLHGPLAVSSIMLEGGWLKNSQETSKEASDSVYLEKYELKSGFYLALTLTQDIKSKCGLEHYLSFLSQPGVVSADTGGFVFNRQNTDFTSLEYGLRLDIPLKKGWKVMPSGKLFYEKSRGVKFIQKINDPINNDFMESYYDFYNYNYWFDDHNDKQDYYYFLSEANYQYETVTETNESVNYQVGFELEKVHKNLTFSGSLFYLQYRDLQNLQSGISGLWYPFGNLNLYFKTKFFYLWRNIANKNELESYTSNPIFEELLGIRMASWCWLEASFLYGNMQNYNETETNTLYIMNNDSKYRLAVQGIFPINESLTLSLMYKYTKKANEVYYYNGVDVIASKVRMNGNILVLGIKWIF